MQVLFIYLFCTHSSDRLLTLLFWIGTFCRLLSPFQGYPGEGNGNPFQYSCLENPVDRGDWWLHSMVLHRVVHDRTTDTSGDSSEICKIQMSFYCEQVDLEVWQYPASDPGFWRASALSLYPPTLLSSKYGGFIFLNWTNCFTSSCPKRSATQVSFKLMSL